MLGPEPKLALQEVLHVLLHSGATGRDAFSVPSAVVSRGEYTIWTRAVDVEEIKMFPHCDDAGGNLLMTWLRKVEVKFDQHCSEELTKAMEKSFVTKQPFHLHELILKPILK